MPELVAGLELTPRRRVGSRARRTAAALPDGRERRRTFDTVGHRQRRVHALGADVPEVLIGLEPATGLRERHDAVVVVRGGSARQEHQVPGALLQDLVQRLPRNIRVPRLVLEELLRVEVAEVILGEVDALDPEPARDLPFLADPPLEQVQRPVGVVGKGRNGGSPVDAKRHRVVVRAAAGTADRVQPLREVRQGGPRVGGLELLEVRHVAVGPRALVQAGQVLAGSDLIDVVEQLAGQPPRIEELLGAMLRHRRPDRLVARIDRRVIPVAVLVQVVAVHLLSVRLEVQVVQALPVGALVGRPAEAGGAQLVTRHPHGVDLLVVGRRDLQAELVQHEAVVDDGAVRDRLEAIAGHERVVVVDSPVLHDVVQPVHGILEDRVDDRIALRIGGDQVVQVDEQPIVDPALPSRNPQPRVAGPHHHDVRRGSGGHRCDDDVSAAAGLDPEVDVELVLNVAPDPILRYQIRVPGGRIPAPVHHSDGYPFHLACAGGLFLARGEDVGTRK